MTQIRCSICLTVIDKKPKAKTPKYCTQCREAQQKEYKQKVKQERQKKFRGYNN